MCKNKTSPKVFETSLFSIGFNAVCLALLIFVNAIIFDLTVFWKLGSKADIPKFGSRNVEIKKTSWLMCWLYLIDQYNIDIDQYN